MPFIVVMVLTIVLPVSVHAQCPAGYNSVARIGYAVGYETNTVVAPSAALGVIQVQDNQGVLYSPNNAPYIDTNGQFLTLNFGELIREGLPITMSLGYFQNTSSRLKIETSSDGVTFNLLGYFSASGGPGGDLFKSTKASQVASHHTFNAPAGGVWRMKFTWVAGSPYVDGVNYSTVCRPSVACTPTPAVSAYALGGNTSNLNGVENAAGALNLDYQSYSALYPDGFSLIYQNNATLGAEKMAGIPGGGTESLIADLGSVIDNTKYVMLNLAGYNGADNQGRKIEITFSTTTTFGATPNVVIGNTKNPSADQNIGKATYYLPDEKMKLYWIPVPSTGVRYIKIVDRGTDYGGPDAYVDFVGYTCSPGPYPFDFGDLTDGLAGNSATDFSTSLASNGPRHEIINTQFAYNPGVFLNSVPSVEVDAGYVPEGSGDDLVLDPLLRTSTSYTISTTALSGTNTIRATANIYAWLDLNRNGIFEPSEFQTTTFPGTSPNGSNPPSNATSALTWSGLPSLTTIPEVALRIRITTNTLTDNGSTAVDERSIGLATDGEVEDYLIPVEGTPCEASTSVGFAVDNQNGMKLFKIDLTKGTKTLVKGNLTNRDLGALGYNVKTEDFWAAVRNSNIMVRITPKGVVTEETIASLPTNKSWQAGDINKDGIMYLHTGATNDPTIYAVNLDPASAGYKSVTTYTLTKDGVNAYVTGNLGPALKDFAFNPDDNKLYFAENGSTNIWKIELPAGGKMDLKLIAGTYFFNSNVQDITGWSHFYFDNVGNLIVLDANGYIGRIPKPSAITTYARVGENLFYDNGGNYISQSGDVARCVTAPILNQVRYTDGDVKKPVVSSFVLSDPTTTSFKASAVVSKVVPGTTIVEQGFYYFPSKILPSVIKAGRFGNKEGYADAVPGKHLSYAIKVPATTVSNNGSITGGTFEAVITGLEKGENYTVAPYFIMSDANGNTWYADGVEFKERGGQDPKYWMSCNFNSRSSGTITTVSRVFAERYSDVVNGNATMVANSLILNSTILQAADIDGVAGTKNSSSADLNLPKGSVVRKAYLYWMIKTQGKYYPVANLTYDACCITTAQRDNRSYPQPAPSDVQKAKALFDGPGAGINYVDQVPALEDFNIINDTQYTWWQGLSDVTSMVRAGGNGTYTVSVPYLDQVLPELQNGLNGNPQTSHMAGWGMIVVYQTAGEPPRQIKIYDGLFTIVPGVGYSTGITGLVTPSVGPLRSTFGMLSMYGDPGDQFGRPGGLKGDYVYISTDKTPEKLVGDALNPAPDEGNSDVFNSTISIYGKNVTTRNPNAGFTSMYEPVNGKSVYTAPGSIYDGGVSDGKWFVDGTGEAIIVPPLYQPFSGNGNGSFIGKNASVAFDADVFDISNNLVPSVSQVNFRFGTAGDVYLSGACFIAVELKAPKLTGTKGLVDLNGGKVEINDVLEYSIAIQNVGDDDAINSSMVDALPTTVDYIPGSLKLTKGFEAGVPVTDDIDADRAYVSSTPSFLVTLPGEAEAVSKDPGTTLTFTEGTLVLNTDGTFQFTPAPNYTGDDIPKVTYVPGNSVVWFIGDNTDPNAAYKLQRNKLDGVQELKYRVVVNSTAFGQPVVNSFKTSAESVFWGFESTGDGTSDITPTPTSINLSGEFILPIYPDVNATTTDLPLKGSVATNEGIKTLVYKTPVADPTNPAGGVLTLKPDGTYTFTAPTPGIYYYDVPACPDNTATVCPINKLAITVTDPYDLLDKPVANTDIATTVKDVPVTLKTLANDKAPLLGTALDPASVKILTPLDSIPGTIAVNPTTGDITFTPDPGFTGYAIYEYEVCDSSDPTPLCTKARQEIQVAGPMAGNVTSAADDYNSDVLGQTQTGNLLTNDFDPEGNTRTVTPQNLTLPEGTVVINADGSYTFTPDPNFMGPLNVPYKVCDNGNPVACAEATLYLIVVDPVNPKDDVKSTPPGVTLNESVRTNDQFFPGTSYGTPTPNANNPPGAVLNFNEDGSYDFTAPTFGVYIYTIDVCGAGQTTDCDTETLTINVIDVKDDVNAGLTNIAVTGDIAENDNTPSGTSYGTPVASKDNPAEASITINADGTYTFTAPVGGVYVYEIPVCQPNQTVNCETQLLTITVIGTDPDVNATFVGVPVKGDVNTNDGVPPGTTYGAPVADAGNPGPATITMNPDGTYVFTAPAPGVYLFDVPVCPEGVTTNCPVEKLRITVLDPAAAANVPVANTDQAVTPLNTPVTIATLANDQPGGVKPLDPASVAVTVQPANGTVTVNTTTGAITYIPNTGFTGVDVYTYTVCDKASPANCTTATQEVTILAADAPNSTFATDDYAATNSITPATGSVKTNDIDAQGDATTVAPQDLTLPEGTFVLNADGTYVFTPAGGFTGPVNIPYQICDDGTPSACANATLYILVSPADTNPDVNATYTSVPVDGSVVTNDDMPAGTTYGTPVPVSSPEGSTPQITMNADGTYTFTGDKPGIYEYDVPVCAPGVTTNCPTEKLTITVLDLFANNPPVANTDLASTEPAVPVTLNTLANDQSGTPGETLDPASVAVTVQPLNGTVSVNPATGAVTYTPKAGFSGLDFYTYKVCDTADPAQCTTAIQEVLVAPPGGPNTTSASDDYNSTYGQVPATGNLLNNDTDAQKDNQTATPQDVTLPEGAFKLNADGSYTFTPASGFVGPVNIPYTVCDDNDPAACASATLYLLVSPGDSDPDINATFTNVPVKGDVSTNDAIPAGATYGTPTPVSKPEGATATLTLKSDGTYDFQGNKPGVYVYDVPVCPAGSASTAECPTERLVINVLDKGGDANLPVASTDIAYTAPATAVTLKTLSNDAAGAAGTNLDPASVAVTVQPTNGTVTVDAVTGDITYTPNANFTGTDIYTYTVCDDASPAACTTAIQEVVVNSSTPGVNLTQAADDFYIGAVGLPLNGSVATNDTDGEGDAQSVTPQTVTLPEGTFTLNSDGTFTFEPALNFSGPVNIPYTTCDDGTPSACAQATLYLLITPVNADPDVNATFVNVAVDGSVVTNDEMPSGTTYGTPVLNSSPSGSAPQITFNADGTYTFTSDLPGVYVYNVPVCSPGVTSNCPTELLTITVLDLNGNNPPVANTDQASTLQGTPVMLNTLANDQTGTPDKPLNPASVQVTVQPLNGTVSVNATTGVVTYTPNSTFTGVDYYTYQVCDTSSPVQCTTAVQEIIVAAPSDPNTTTAADDYNSTWGQNPAKGNLLTNDNDAQGNKQTATPQDIVLPEGTFKLNADGSYTFTPTPGFVGPVSIPYTICDDNVSFACSSATLYLLVTPGESDPDVNATFTNIPVKGDVSTNDDVPAGTTYGTPAPVSKPDGAIATITLKPDGTYDFKADKPGVYVYDVPLCPYGITVECPTERLVITVLDKTGDPNAPVANTDIAYTAPSTPVTLNTLSNDGVGGLGRALDPATVAVTVQPANGTVSVDPATGNITYTPNANFTGLDVYTYTVCDNASPAQCATAVQEVTVTATISGINQTQAADDYALGTGDDIISGNVLDNDTDAQGDTQTVTPQSLTLPEGTFTLNADGSYTFDPVAGFSGPLNIPYTTCDDGTPSVCADATLYILVRPFVPQPDVNATFVNKPINGTVTTNDQVFEGAQYSVESANPANPTGGQLTLNPDGTYDFTSPNPGIYKYNCYVCNQITTTGQVPPCKIVELTITVLDPLSVTEGPIANTDIAVTEAATPVVLKTLANDAPGSITTALVPSSVAIATQPANGTVSVNPATGDITYTPNAGFTGIDEYTYTVCDNQTPAKCATAVQKVMVNAPDLANTTLAADDFAATIGSSPVSGSVLTNDTDPEGNSRTVVPQMVTNANGTLKLNADGTYTFTAVPGFSGPVEYPYEVCDNGTPKACASATLYILVRLAAIDAVNDDYSSTPVNGYTGGSPGNIFTNDQVNNLPLVANDVTVSVVNNGGLTGVTIASNGTITVPAGTPAGTYNVTYKICQKLVPTLCDEAVVTIVVNPPAILATTDDLTATPISNEKGGIAGNIFPNDQLNNTTIDGEIKSDVTITLLNDGGLTGVTIADDGTVTVPPGTEPGTYTLRYKICDNLNPTNCSEADVIILIEQTVLVIPDGISPNGDGLNEVFFIEGLTAYPDNEILIFNRWGNKVFEAKPYLNNWDGTSSSNLTVGSANRLPAGTYFYVLKLTEKKTVTGYIYIAY